MPTFGQVPNRGQHHASRAAGSEVVQNGNASSIEERQVRQFGLTLADTAPIVSGENCKCIVRWAVCFVADSLKGPGSTRMR